MRVPRLATSGIRAKTKAAIPNGGGRTWLPGVGSRQRPAPLTGSSPTLRNFKQEAACKQIPEKVTAWSGSRSFIVAHRMAHASGSRTCVTYTCATHMGRGRRLDPDSTTLRYTRISSQRPCSSFKALYRCASESLNGPPRAAREQKQHEKNLTSADGKTPQPRSRIHTATSTSQHSLFFATRPW